MPDIRLSNTNRNIRAMGKNYKISLKHSGQRGPTGEQGPQGPEGPQGPTGVSTFVRVHHGTDPNIPRPDALYVEWVGSVAPVNATVEDTWIDIS